MVWYSHLLKKFPQFVVTHTVRGFSVVNKSEVDAFLELFCFFYDPVDVGNLISGLEKKYKLIKIEFWDFPSSLVVKTPCLHCRGQEFDP